MDWARAVLVGIYVGVIATLIVQKLHRRINELERHVWETNAHPGLFEPRTFSKTRPVSVIAPDAAPEARRQAVRDFAADLGIVITDELE